MPEMTHKNPHRDRFESEVHVVLLLIIFVLLFLACISNFVIYRSRTRLTEQCRGRLDSAALLINRRVAEYYPNRVPDSVIASLCQRYSLTEILAVPSRPSDNSPEAKRRWLVNALGSIPATKLPVLADQLFSAEFDDLSPCFDESYGLVATSQHGGGYPFLVLTQRIPELAFLDRSSQWILTMSIISIAFLAGLYAYLSRRIFAPFRRIRQQAARAGRPIDAAENEAEAAAIEYQRIIDELHANQDELLRLNAAIRSKADSLEQFNEYLLNSTDAGAMTLDRRGHVLAINKTALRLLGRGALRDKTMYRDLFAGHESVIAEVETALASGALPGYREEPWGDVPLGVSMSFVRNDTGETIGLWILLFDLAETAVLRKELESQKQLSALGEMAGGLAHQLRNSVGAISGYGSLVRKLLVQSDTATAQIDSLIAETKQADQLIRRFLSFARPLDFEPTPTALDLAIQETIESFRVRPQFAHISITGRFEENPGPTVELDSLLFKQAIGNLVENAALAYLDQTGEIEISSAICGNEVRVSIADHGHGIPADKLEKVFTPFYTSRPDGTGLGLPLAARIIQMHHGRLTLVSRVGEGTVATIVLPLISGHALHPASHPVSAHA